MTVLENVLVAAQGQAGERVWANWFRPGAVAAEERGTSPRARELLDFVTLDALARQPARILSGGQRKLLELARVLMADPALILLDEPAAGVNPSLCETIIDAHRRDQPHGRHLPDHRAQHGHGRAALPARAGHGRRAAAGRGHAGRGRPRRAGHRGLSRRRRRHERGSDAPRRGPWSPATSPACRSCAASPSTFRRGEIVAVLGPNGAGKSTLIKAIAGLVPIFAGRVLLEASDITDLAAHEASARASPSCRRPRTSSPA